MQIIFIRHGQTNGNAKGQYIGITDEPLCQNGISQLENLHYPQAERVISSPLKRCIQTAEIIYGVTPEIFSDLRECNFGDFEGRSYNDLKNDKNYVLWLASGGTMPFPDGENPDDFKKRCCSCFEQIIKTSTDSTVAIIAHGGTIMAILEKYARPQKGFYDWQIKNGVFLCFNVIKNPLSLELVEKLL